MRAEWSRGRAGTCRGRRRTASGRRRTCPAPAAADTERDRQKPGGYGRRGGTNLQGGCRIRTDGLVARCSWENSELRGDDASNQHVGTAAPGCQPGAAPALLRWNPHCEWKGLVLLSPRDGEGCGGVDDQIADVVHSVQQVNEDRHEIGRAPCR